MLTTSDVPEQYWQAARLVGETPFFACQADPRILYCLYVPPPHYGSRSLGKSIPLVVHVHGSLRKAQDCRDSMVDLADRTGAAILAPLFPAGLEGPDDMHGYKFVRAGQDKTAMRYDLALLEILDEVAIRWPEIDVSRFFLCGFSGDGQFALRFAYFHPDRLEGVSIGAPGMVTHLDMTIPWPFGLQDVADYLDGELVSVEALSTIRAIQLVVGEDDIGAVNDGLWAFALGHGPMHVAPTQDPMVKAQKLPSRLDALKILHQEMVSAGIHATLTTVPGVAHEGRRILPGVLEWLEPLVVARRLV